MALIKTHAGRQLVDCRSVAGTTITQNDQQHEYTVTIPGVVARVMPNDQLQLVPSALGASVVEIRFLSQGIGESAFLVTYSNASSPNPAALTRQQWIDAVEDLKGDSVANLDTLTVTTLTSTTHNAGAITASGAIAGNSVSATGAVSAASASIAGLMAANQVNATTSLNGASASITGLVTANQVNATTSLNAATSTLTTGLLAGSGLRALTWQGLAYGEVNSGSATLSLGSGNAALLSFISNVIEDAAGLQAPNPENWLIPSNGFAIVHLQVFISITSIANFTETHASTIQIIRNKAAGATLDPGDEIVASAEGHLGTPAESTSQHYIGCFGMCRVNAGDTLTVRYSDGGNANPGTTDVSITLGDAGDIALKHCRKRIWFFPQALP